MNVTALKASGGESDCDQGGGGGRAPLATRRGVDKDKLRRTSISHTARSSHAARQVQRRGRGGGGGGDGGHGGGGGGRGGDDGASPRVDDASPRVMRAEA